MRTGWEYWKADMRRYGPVLLLIVLYMYVMGVLLGLPVCPMVLFTGLPCPACGMTRSLLLFLQGEFQKAFAMHPFFYLLLVWILAAGGCRYVLGRCLRWMIKILYIIAVAAIIFYFFRMWKYFPGREPMVYWEQAFLFRIYKRLCLGAL